MATAIYLCFTVLLMAAAAAEAGAPELQQLLDFKSALPNPDNALPTWVSSGDPCSFTGVTCSIAGRVVSIHLSGTTLGADIRLVTTHLFPIDSLESLSLKDANLTGFLTVAGSARCGSRLAELDLSGNKIRGSLTELPALVSLCPGLRTLNLSSNALSFSAALAGGAARPYPASASGSLSALEQLDLSYNKVSGSAALGWLFVAAPSLQHLDVSGNGLSGGIPIGECSSLSYLDLSSNALADLRGGRSGGGFANCRNLAFLNLSTNHFSGEFPEELLASCGSLTDLDVSYNNFSGGVPTSLSSCSNLESINLSNNNFSGDFPMETLAKLSNVKKMELGFNYFSGNLPESLLSDLPRLEVLDLSSNSLTGRIPPGFCSVASKGRPPPLQELYLQNNLLTGPIPQSISNCSALRSLYLSFNYLSGEIPASLGQLEDLRHLIAWQNALSGPIPGELGGAFRLENLILDNNGLTGAIPAGLSNCTSLNWLSLSSNVINGSIPPWVGGLENLAILKLGNNTLSGPIPAEIGKCRSLIWLDLNSNSLSGPIPPSIADQSGAIASGLVKGKRYVYLRNDGSRACHGAGNLLEFAGIRQSQLSRVPTRQSCHFTQVYQGNTEYSFSHNGSIIFMDLSYNNLSGPIPPELGRMLYVQVLNLGHNKLSGPIPAELGDMHFIGILDLSHNALSGPIPSSFSGLNSLTEFDVSNNQLSGAIPESGQPSTMPAYRYEGNPGLCGFPLPKCITNSSAGAARVDDQQQQQRNRRKKQASVAGSVAMGLLFSFFCVVGLTIVLIESKKRRKKRQEQQQQLKDSIDNMSRSRESIAADSQWWKDLASTTRGDAALSISLAAFESPLSALKKLTLADLVEATNGFSPDTLIGSGGFGDVYKAQLKDNSTVAVKKLKHAGIGGQGDREFTAEMETIGKIRHRNLVPLLGYCKVGEERLLVYEFMKHGSLEDVLHRHRGQKGSIRLGWSARRRIAVGSARGLAFLHHSCIPHVIHRDMKSSNVLLDADLEARVADFGMARLVSAAETHLSVSTLAGTPGYVPPEYYQSFRCSTKGDVYSFGVVLLELLTGKHPVEAPEYGAGDLNLVGWVRQQMRAGKVAEVFDREMMVVDGEEPGLVLELREHLKIAMACLEDRPTRRPTMVKVMAMFKEIQAGSTIDSTASAASITSSTGGFGMRLEECKEENE